MTFKMGSNLSGGIKLTAARTPSRTHPGLREPRRAALRATGPQFVLKSGLRRAVASQSSTAREKIQTAVHRAGLSIRKLLNETSRPLTRAELEPMLRDRGVIPTTIALASGLLASLETSKPL